jgi:hypothetical protein
VPRANISLIAKSNVSADLKLDFRFDDLPIWSTTLTDQVQNFYHEFDDAPAPHRFEIELSNKNREQTKINEHHEIVEDVFAEILDVKISGIDLGHVFYGQSLYYHDYNGTTGPVVGQFFQRLGCNGIVKFNFYTPAYVWLFENI